MPIILIPSSPILRGSDLFFKSYSFNPTLDLNLNFILDLTFDFILDFTLHLTLDLTLQL